MTWTAEDPHIDGIAWWREHARCGVAFDYDEAAVAAIKQLPRSWRRYDPALRCWWLRDEPSALMVLGDLQRIVGRLTALAGRPEWLQERAEWIAARSYSRPAASPTLTASSAYRTLFLQPDAPPELIVAAYKTLAKLHHPDAGGNPDRMRALNEAFEELSQ
jgi:hypothetical protein